MVCRSVFSNMVYAVEQWGGAPSATGNMCIQVDEGYFRAMSTARGLGMDTNKSTSGRYTCASKGFGTDAKNSLGNMKIGGGEFKAFDQNAFDADAGVCQHSCNHVNKALVRVTD